jgi:hypothetical protein
LLEEVHLHVDEGFENKVPKDKTGLYTVAPGQFGLVVSDVNDVFFTATFPDVAPTFYVIAHAVVAGSSSAWSNNPGC